jgi:hypothetical protein
VPLPREKVRLRVRRRAREQPIPVVGMRDWLHALPWGDQGRVLSLGADPLDDGRQLLDGGTCGADSGTLHGEPPACTAIPRIRGAVGGLDRLASWFDVKINTGLNGDRSLASATPTCSGAGVETMQWYAGLNQDRFE